MRILMIALAVLVASSATALMSKDTPSPECPGCQPTVSDFHQLEWRPLPADAWIEVGSLQPVVAGLTHPDQSAQFAGVDWDLTGTVVNYGEWRAIAVRRGRESGPSNAINLGVPEPPLPPLMLSGLTALAWLSRRRRLGSPS